MTCKCRKCEQILKEGENVRVVVEAVYHAIPSRIMFAIDGISNADASTLEHEDCLEGER